MDENEKIPFCQDKWFMEVYGEWLDLMLRTKKREAFLESETINAAIEDKLTVELLCSFAYFFGDKLRAEYPRMFLGLHNYFTTSDWSSDIAQIKKRFDEDLPW